MDFTVHNISLENFRNHEITTVELDASLTVLVGPNAAGKTNVIEALQIMMVGDSFRRPKWAEVVTTGSERARMRLEAEADTLPMTAGLEISAHGRRTYTFNGKRIKSGKDLLGKMPCVVFTPDDLYLVKGPAEERRRSIDEAGDQISPAYQQLRMEYARILKQRNAALKEGEESSVLHDLDEIFVAAASRLTAHRARLVERIALKAAAHHARLGGGEDLKVRLEPALARKGIDTNPDSEDALKEALLRLLPSVRAEEAARGTSVLGPHRDDIVFTIDGDEARVRSSQGQQRSAALAWKLAEVDVIEDVIGRRPILLLDDVMSELDEKRRHALARLVGEGTQAVVTTTEADYLPGEVLAQAQVVEIGS